MTAFICTTEKSGMDRHSQELAKLLPVRSVFTDRYKIGTHIDSLVRQLAVLDEQIHFSNQHFGRIALGIDLPFIITVHDLERICFPHAPEDPVARMELDLDALAIKKADHVIAVSDNTKKDLVRHLDISADKISVIHNGVDHAVFKPNGTGKLPFPYVLYVGSERPRKNLETILSALARLKKQGDFPDLKLVKVGSPGRSETYREATLDFVNKLGLQDQVVFVGHVPDQELSTYYSSARALVYPSLYEGFGLPIVEAMACGCPVITSSISSLPEVGGEAGLYVDPHDVAGLMQTIAQVLRDESLRAQMIKRGIERSSQFSWTKAANATMDVYRQVQEHSFGQKNKCPC